MSANRRDFPGGLTAQEYLDMPRTDAELMRDLAHLGRALSRVRHGRESLARTGAALHISRESIRKVGHISEDDDLAARLAAGGESIATVWREYRARRGLDTDRRTSVSIKDPRAAIRVLLRHYDPQEIADALTQELGYASQGGTR